MQPGPGQYAYTPTLNSKGNYYVSKFKSSQARTFGSERRKSYVEMVGRVGTPGPGSYGSTSNFFAVGKRSDIVREATKIVSRIFIKTPGKEKEEKDENEKNGEKKRRASTPGPYASRKNKMKMMDNDMRKEKEIIKITRENSVENKEINK